MTYTPYGYPTFFSPAYMPRTEMAPPAAQTPGGIMCKPVTSKAEAEVAQIPFDGSTAWFYDTAADRMYAKTFNLKDGTAPIVTYVKEKPEAPVQYATVEQLREVAEEVRKLRERTEPKGEE